MLRLIGAALVTLSASLVGFGFARGVRRQCAQLEGLLWALDFMQAELSSRLTPLPQLFSMLSAGKGTWRCFLKPPGARCLSRRDVRFRSRSNGAFRPPRGSLRGRRPCRRSMDSQRRSDDLIWSPNWLPLSVRREALHPFFCNCRRKSAPGAEAMKPSASARGSRWPSFYCNDGN